MIETEYILEVLCNTLVETGAITNIHEVRWMKDDSNPRKGIIIIQELQDEYSFFIVSVAKGTIKSD